MRELLYPPKCCSCGRIVKDGEYVCLRCFRELKRVKEPVCPVCGKTVEGNSGTWCYDCERRRHYFVRNRSLFEYSDNMKQMMYALKYRHNLRAGRFMGMELARAFEGDIKAMNPDGIVPIPISRKRQRMRGYNQAEVIADQIGAYCNLKVYPDYLVREKETRPQKELNDRERKNNVKNAFHISENEVQLKKILLVDDIYTTGTTLDEAAWVLRKAGVETVYGMTVCIGRGF